MLAGVIVKISMAEAHGLCCSSGWPRRAAVLGARIDRLAGTSETEHMSMGVHKPGW